MVLLLDLPSELIVAILANIPINDLASCIIACHALRHIVQNSVLLQYYIELHIAGAKDNDDFPANLAEKRAILHEHQRAWHSIKPKRRIFIQIPFLASTIYDLTGGYYFLGESHQRTSRSTDAVRYLHLGPSSLGTHSQWMCVDLGKPIVDIAVCAQEHDLIALVTVKRESNASSTIPGHIYEIHFQQLSTGTPHPDAKSSTVPLVVAPNGMGRPAVVLEVVGNYLCILLSFTFDSARDLFYILDWRTGKKVASFSERWYTYVSFAYLRHDLLVFPNIYTFRLDIRRIPGRVPQHSGQINPTYLGPNGTPDTSENLSPIPIILSIALPSLSPSCRIVYITCRSEPNHIDKSSNHVLGDSIYDDPDAAIIVFNMNIQDVNPLTITPLEAFSFVVHRRTLLEIVFRYGEASMTLPHGEMAEENLSPIGHFITAWETWGPQNTHWFELDSRWITTSCGTRYVQISEIEQGAGGNISSRPIRVLDFALPRIRRAILELERLKIEMEENRNLGQSFARAFVTSFLLERDEEPALPFAYSDIPEMIPSAVSWVLDEKDTPLAPATGEIVPGEVRLVARGGALVCHSFSKDICSGLPFIEVASRELFKSEDIITDGRNIVALNMDADDHVAGLDILHIG